MIEGRQAQGHHPAAGRRPSWPSPAAWTPPCSSRSAATPRTGERHRRDGRLADLHARGEEDGPARRPRARRPARPHRDRRARLRGLRGQSGRPLLSLQARALRPDRRPGPDARRSDAFYDASNVDDLSDYRPGRRATEEFGVVQPARPGRLHQEGRPGPVEEARPRLLGQAGQSLPGQPRPLRHAHHARDARPGSGPARSSSGAWASPSSGSATTASWPASRSRPADLARLIRPATARRIAAKLQVARLSLDRRSTSKATAWAASTGRSRTGPGQEARADEDRRRPERRGRLLRRRAPPPPGRTRGLRRPDEALARPGARRPPVKSACYGPDEAEDIRAAGDVCARLGIPLSRRRLLRGLRGPRPPLFPRRPTRPGRRRTPASAATSWSSSASCRRSPGPRDSSSTASPRATTPASSATTPRRAGSC